MVRHRGQRRLLQMIVALELLNRREDARLQDGRRVIPSGLEPGMVLRLQNYPHQAVLPFAPPVIRFTGSIARSRCVKSFDSSLSSLQYSLGKGIRSILTSVRGVSPRCRGNGLCPVSKK